MAVATRRARIRKIEATIDAEKMRKIKATENLAKLRVELKHARASK